MTTISIYSILLFARAYWSAVNRYLSFSIDRSKEERKIFEIFKRHTVVKSERKGKVVSEQEVEKALRGVKDPELGIDVVSLGFVRSIQIKDGGRLAVSMVIGTPECIECNADLISEITSQIKEKVQRIRGVTQVTVEFLKNASSS